MADLRIDTRESFFLATIIARKGVAADRIGRVLGLDAPTSPLRSIGRSGLSLIGTGPGTWLAYVDGVSQFSVEELRRRLYGIASVSDQSSAYVVLRLSGQDARNVLQSGMPIDLHQDVFGPGAVATTVISHMGVIVWQLDDQPTYELATARSLSDSIRRWLDQAVVAL